MAVQIEMRNDTAANWALANPVLGDGEPGFDADHGVLKIGDGTTPFVSLPTHSTARNGVLYIENFFAPGRVAGITDDTAALQAAVIAAAGKTLVVGSNALRITQNIEITTGLTVDARGGSINCIDDGSATGVGIWAHDLTGFAWLGGTLTQSAASRSGVYGLLRLERVITANVDAISIVGGSSTGIFVIGGQYITLRAPRVSNTKADGIHISRGTTDWQIISPIINNTGDDGIGVVAVTAEPGSGATYPVVKRGIISDPIITGLTAVGGGVSFVGAADCSLRGGVIDGTPTAGVKITNDVGAGAAQSASNIIVTGTQVRNVVNGYLVGPSLDCQLVSTAAMGCSDSGVSTNGATRLLVSGGKYRGNAGFGFYEAAGTGNYVVGADLRGNTIGAFQASSATSVSTITA